jgi:hypothetical protein
VDAASGTQEIRMRRLTVSLIAAAATAASVLPAPAQPVSYQGRFTDNTQTPVGDYQLRFTVYDSVSGGNPVGSALTRSVTMAASDEGIFSFQDLNFGPGVFTGPLRWLEIAVSENGEPFTALSPRQPLNPTPQAIYAEKSGTTLHDAFVNGAQISNATIGPMRITGTLQMGTPTSSGALQVFQNGTTPAIAQIFNLGGHGGSLRLRDEAGVDIVQLEADPQGVGAGLRIFGDGGEFFFDGDIGAGSGSGTRLTVGGPSASFVFDSKLTVSGPASIFEFDPAVEGDASLVLPPDSVGPDELFSAMGIASVFRNQAVSIGSSISTVTSRSITVPGPGYVVAIATASIGVVRVSNADGLALMAVSDVSNTMPFATRTAIGMPRSSLTFGQYNFPGASHGVFDVAAAGQYTFYFNASSTGFGTPAISNANLTLFFVPTTYGDVTPNMLANSPGYGIVDPLTREQILTEQLAEQQRALAELRAEQAGMRAEMDALRRRTENR